MRLLSWVSSIAVLLTLAQSCGDDSSSPKDTATDVQQDAGGQDASGEAGSTLGPNSGQTCDQSTPCPTGDECLLLTGWTKGMCFAKCTKQNDACTTADSTKLLSICSMTDKSQTQWYCLFVCEAQGVTYECPEATQECVASTTAGVKICKPK